jgi:hypothetical protein
LTGPRRATEARLYFQTLDDKSECVGVYTNGKLFFDSLPEGITRTWRHSGALTDTSIEYAWLYTDGQNLQQVCPDKFKDQLTATQNKFRAYLKSFKIAKINLRELCFFDLVPHDFLLEFCEIKNKITQHVFDNFTKPKNYDHLSEIHRLLHKIKFNDLLLDTRDSRNLLTNTRDRNRINKLLSGPKHIDYNLFGTATGRLTTFTNSFPMLTLKKQLRQIVKPKNDWFISLDYNGAEIRTVLALSDEPQPDYDIHLWNCKNVFGGHVERDEAKEKFFAWLYNPDSTEIENDFYNRDKLLKQHYSEGCVTTPFGRVIEVEKRKAFNYLIQSTTSDIVLQQAVKLDQFLENKKSFISHIVHDEVVIDLHDSERNIVPLMRNIFENNIFGHFVSNVDAGKDYYALKELKL